MATITNFFNQIALLDIQGNLQLNIAKVAQDKLIVSILLHNEQCGDNAKKLIPPLNLRGTAQELDEGFFQQISTPLQSASGLMVDMEQFMKQLDEVKKLSAMQKEKTVKQKSQIDSKDKKYQDAMVTVNELDKQGKPREAWMKLPCVKEFPEHAETIRKRRTELSAQFAPDLFETKEPQLTETDEEALFPKYQTDEIEQEMEFETDDTEEY